MVRFAKSEGEKGHLYIYTRKVIYSEKKLC